MSACTNVDCDAGMRLGCQTYCCRLLVRLDPEEREICDGSTTAKGYVDKTRMATAFILTVRHASAKTGISAPCLS